MKRSGRIVVAVALATAVGVVPVHGSAKRPLTFGAPVVVASGLDNPRHLTFTSKGELYVAEAGTGGPRGEGGNCADHPTLGRFCLGTTGAMTQVRDDGPDVEVLSGLPSIASETEALGPSDISFTGTRRFTLSIGLGGSDTFRSSFGPDGALLGTLVSGTLGRGGVELLADVLANEAAANPDGTDIDSNPVGILRRGAAHVVADAGGNAVVSVDRRQQFATLAVLPGVPSSLGFPADAVPTSVVRGRDGAFYVSQLVGFPFDPGTSSIWRLAPGRAPSVYATGLTNVTDLAFGPDGRLYAVEIAADGLQDGPIGAVVAVTPGGSTHTPVLEDVFAPYGIAFGKQAMYVTTGAVLPGGGEVLRVPIS
jgi:hypothetical protein